MFGAYDLFFFSFYRAGTSMQPRAGAGNLARSLSVSALPFSVIRPHHSQRTSVCRINQDGWGRHVCTRVPRCWGCPVGRLGVGGGVRLCMCVAGEGSVPHGDNKVLAEHLLGLNHCPGSHGQSKGEACLLPSEDEPPAWARGL